MIDDSATVRDFLLANGTLVALIDTRLYAEVDTPPAGYAPTAGPCICFKRRGGGMDYPAVNLWPSYQFKIYGQAGGLSSPEASANEVYRALFDALHYQGSYLVRGAEMEAGGQTLHEPDTGWAFVLVFYQVNVLN